MHRVLPITPALPREERQANAYDNALRYLDDVLAEMIERFEQLEGERYLVISGDHGQLPGRADPAQMGTADPRP